MHGSGSHTPSMHLPGCMSPPGLQELAAHTNLVQGAFIQVHDRRRGPATGGEARSCGKRHTPPPAGKRPAVIRCDALGRRLRNSQAHLHVSSPLHSLCVRGRWGLGWWRGGGGWGGGGETLSAESLPERVPERVPKESAAWNLPHGIYRMSPPLPPPHSLPPLPPPHHGPPAAPRPVHLTMHASPSGEKAQTPGEPGEPDASATLSHAQPRPAAPSHAQPRSATRPCPRSIYAPSTLTHAQPRAPLLPTLHPRSIHAQPRAPSKLPSSATRTFKLPHSTATLTHSTVATHTESAVMHARGPS
jgi:hypothetical protein